MSNKVEVNRKDIAKLIGMSNIIVELLEKEGVESY